MRGSSPDRETLMHRFRESHGVCRVPKICAHRRKSRARRVFFVLTLCGGIWWATGALENGYAVKEFDKAKRLFAARPPTLKRRNATVTLIKASLDESYIVSLANWVRSVEHLGDETCLLIDDDSYEARLRPKVRSYLNDKAYNRIRIIDVSAEFAPCSAQAKSEYCVRTKLSEEKPDGYKKMCRLWYSAVWKYLRRYDYVLRFDEDNILVHGQWPEDITYFGTVKCVPQDSADVTEGLTEFFWNSERRHYEKYYPYTNVMFVNVQWALTDITVQNMFRAVEDSNCICINRWGDLPLWGETLARLGVRPRVLHGWSYVHTSHGDNVLHDEPGSC